MIENVMTVIHYPWGDQYKDGGINHDSSAFIQSENLVNHA
jgi:hypothetical protein